MGEHCFRLSLSGYSLITSCTYGSFAGKAVEFWILLGNKLVPVSAEPDDPLAMLFTHLPKNVAAAKHLPANVAFDECEFYQLKTPVLLSRHDVQQACLEESNRIHVDPIRTSVVLLAPKFSRNYVNLVIELPDRKQIWVPSALCC